MTDVEQAPPAASAAVGGGENPDLLVFLHIPKTAGRTFVTVLDRQYPAGTVYQTRGLEWRRSVEQLRVLPDADKRALRVVQGHMGFGIHEAFPQPARYVAFLRDPVARVVSHYHHVLGEPENYLHDEVVGRKLSLLEYAQSGLSAELENGQMRLLAGPDDQLVESTSANLELAKRHVRDHFALLGLTERFDESLLLLKRELRWGNVRYERRNVGVRADARRVDGDVAAAICERNALDLELYRWCEELLEQRIAAAGPSFDRELRLFRAWNPLYGRLHSAARSVRDRVRR